MVCLLYVRKEAEVVLVKQWYGVLCNGTNMLSALYCAAQQLEDPVGLARGSALFLPHVSNFLSLILQCVLGFCECSWYQKPCLAQPQRLAGPANLAMKGEVNHIFIFFFFFFGYSFFFSWDWKADPVSTNFFRSSHSCHLNINPLVLLKIGTWRQWQLAFWNHFTQ